MFWYVMGIYGGYTLVMFFWNMVGIYGGKHARRVLAARGHSFIARNTVVISLARGKFLWRETLSTAVLLTTW